MANNSRTKNTILNFTSSIIGQFITIIMQFAVRTVFIKTLGKSYLGISGLFSNILSMLSLAEMGIGSAIIFKLYEPLSKKDESRIKILMNFYKVVYRYIGIVVAIIGVLVIPFLPKLINDYDKLQVLGINTVFIFCLYLFDSVASYLFLAYKSAIIKADQKEYNINLISYIFTISTGVIQIIALIVFVRFDIYVIITVIKTILQNLIIALYVDRSYPFLKKQEKQRLSTAEAISIFKDCGALFIYKINNVVVKSTDNIVLSAFIGLDCVALYSNYLIFYTTIRGMIVKVFNSVGHSIGNLHAIGNSKKEYKVFESTMFISYILGGTAFVGIFVVSDELIRMWIGSNWVILQPFSFLMGLEIFTASVKQALAKYRTAYGLFRQGWARPLAGMVINLVLSIILVKRMGITGVLVGTIVSDWATCVWFDPIILHKNGFKKEFPVHIYFIKFVKNFIVVFAVGLIDYWICTNFMVGYGWGSVIVHAFICGITVPFALYFMSFTTQEAKYLRSIINREVIKIKHKILG